MSTNEIKVTVTDRDTTFKKAGLIVTAAWLALVVIYVVAQWGAILTLRPHDLATFLGGVFAPLAFLWLVLGYFQQGEELRHSVEALRLQAQELGHSVEQQKALVTATRDQIDHERAMIEENERKAAIANAPRFRITDFGTDSHDQMIRRRFELTNHGAPVRDVSIKSYPSGVVSEIAHFDNTVSESLDITHIRDGYYATTIEVSFCDARNVDGNVTFFIPIEDVPGYGLTAGKPRQL